MVNENIKFMFAQIFFFNISNKYIPKQTAQSISSAIEIVEKLDSP